MLDYGKRHPFFRRMPHHQRLLESVTGERAGLYLEQLSPKLCAACERQAREALQAFGYL